jgi:hypothetical protein
VIQLRLIRATVATVLVALGVAGCGGGGDRSAIEKVTHNYTTALASGNGRMACAQLTESEVTALLNSVSQDINSSSCASAVDQVSNSLGGDGAAKVRNARLINLRIQGNNARGTLAGSSIQIRFLKVSGHWYISGGV